eukprot:CAMPEP_0181141170 /NCGR_PEP_ID=MMETSP1071-20121207/35683_1 /TAXON_ID=35127 /ORGANISM="Thalassiosira sp., Strain NH16" /LENGTH=141 /DNA_ID=CAMNT_0023228147 /DNA_START=59 /DNA_END=484 /DNA_ORIENTATION=+
MKVFSSLVAVLFTSAAAAPAVLEVIGNPAIRSALVAQLSSDPTGNQTYPCLHEGEDLVDCIGEDAGECFVDLIFDIWNMTCTEAQANEHLCGDIVHCLKKVPNGTDCAAEDKALETCASAAYPEKNLKCPLCEAPPTVAIA